MATFPFNKFPNTEVILYVNREFAIASGYDRKDPQNANGANILSIGIRWLVSRNDIKNQRQPSLGYPNRDATSCWFIMPDYFAICLLNCIKNNSSSAKGATIKIPEIDKAIQTLNQQIAKRISTQGDTNKN